MKDKEDEEFKKRIRELVKNLDKMDLDSQYTEQDLIEARERFLSIKILSCTIFSLNTDDYT